MDDEIDRSWAEFQWKQFMENLPEALQGATMQKAQRAGIEKLVAEYGPDVLLAIIARWMDHRDLPIEGRKANKWGALLDEITPHIEPGRKECKRRMRDRMQREARAAWDKLRSDLQARGKLDDTFLESRWSLGQQDKTSIADFMKAEFDYATSANIRRPATEVVERYDYWLSENAGTLEWDEGITEDFESFQARKAKLSRN
jgi:hypothetical protein